MSKEQKTIKIPEGFKAVSFDNNTGEILLEKAPVCITESIKTFNDVFHYHGLQTDDIDAVHYWFMDNAFDHMYFQWLAELIVSALNEGWDPDFDLLNQDKYLLDCSLSECFNLTGYTFCISVPARLLFKNEKLAQHVLNTPEFLDIFKEFMIIEKD